MAEKLGRKFGVINFGTKEIVVVNKKGKHSTLLVFVQELGSIYFGTKEIIAVHTKRGSFQIF